MGFILNRSVVPRIDGFGLMSEQRASWVQNSQSLFVIELFSSTTRPWRKDKSVHFSRLLRNRLKGDGREKKASRVGLIKSDLPFLTCDKTRPLFSLEQSWQMALLRSALCGLSAQFSNHVGNTVLFKQTTLSPSVKIVTENNVFVCSNSSRWKSHNNQDKNSLNNRERAKKSLITQSMIK